MNHRILRKLLSLSFITVWLVGCGMVGQSLQAQSNSFTPGNARHRQPTNRLGAYASQTAPSVEDIDYRQQGYIDVANCAVTFIDDIELPALESGQIKMLSVLEGEAFPSGKAVGQIDDTLYRSMLEQAKLRMTIAQHKANDQTSLQAAEKKIKLAEVEYRRIYNLYQKGSKSKSEWEKAQFSLQIALLEKTAAENEQQNASGEWKIEQARVKEVEERIRRHAITSNFDGYVIKIFRHPLEWVNAGDKVMRVARMDELWVQGTISALQLNPHEVIKRPVTVTLKLAQGQAKEFQGKIAYVGLERESRDRYLVKARIVNEPIQGHWLLQPNSIVSMRIHLR